MQTAFYNKSVGSKISWGYGDRTVKRYNKLVAYTANIEDIKGEKLFIKRIKIGKASSGWRQSYCHEIAHALVLPYMDSKKCGVKVLAKVKGEWTHYRRMNELFAWRLAKTFCKPEYWTDAYAIKCLKSYGLVVSQIVPLTDMEEVLQFAVDND